MILRKRSAASVISVALMYYDVELTENDEDLAEELKLCRGDVSDTASRARLGQAIVNCVMGDTIPVPRDALLGDDFPGWHWPLNGSDRKYTNEFFKTFATRALKQKIVLGKTWKIWI